MIFSLHKKPEESGSDTVKDVQQLQLQIQDSGYDIVSLPIHRMGFMVGTCLRVPALAGGRRPQVLPCLTLTLNGRKEAI